MLRHFTTLPQAVSHHFSARDIDERISARLSRPDDGSGVHPNLKRLLRYYDGAAHHEMHMMDNRYWNFLRGNKGHLTAEFIDLTLTLTLIGNEGHLTADFIDKSFTKSDVAYEQLSEIKVSSAALSCPDPYAAAPTV